MRAPIRSVVRSPKPSSDGCRRNDATHHVDQHRHMHVEVRVNTENYFALFSQIAHPVLLHAWGRIANPFAGQDTHGAEQSSYQVTDERPGNARGTPDRSRQVNAKARWPIPARVRLGRTFNAILD